MNFYTWENCNGEACKREREENRPLPITTIIYEFNYYCRKCSTYWRKDVHFNPQKTKRPYCPCCKKQVSTVPSNKNGRQKALRKKYQRNLQERAGELEAIILSAKVEEQKQQEKTDREAELIIQQAIRTGRLPW